MNQNLKDHLLSAATGVAFGVVFIGSLVGMATNVGVFVAAGFGIGLAAVPAMIYIVIKKADIFRPASLLAGLLTGIVGLTATSHHYGLLQKPTSLPEKSALTATFTGACEKATLTYQGNMVTLTLPEKCLSQVKRF